MELKLTNEQLDQIKGMLPFSLDATEEFVPTIFEQVPEEFRPIFVIKAMTPADKQKYSEESFKLNNNINVAGKEKLTVSTNTVLSQIASKSIVAIKNIYNPETGGFLDAETENGHVKTSIFLSFPESSKVPVLRRIGYISGIGTQEESAL